MTSTSAGRALQSTFLSSRRTREAAPHVWEKMERNYRSDRKGYRSTSAMARGRSFIVCPSE